VAAATAAEEEGEALVGVLVASTSIALPRLPLLLLLLLILEVGAATEIFVSEAKESDEMTGFDDPVLLLLSGIAHLDAALMLDTAAVLVVGKVTFFELIEIVSAALDDDINSFVVLLLPREYDTECDTDKDAPALILLLQIVATVDVALICLSKSTTVVIRPPGARAVTEEAIAA